jgi:hypothetical protein
MSNIFDYSTIKTVHKIIDSIDLINLISELQKHDLSLNLLSLDLSTKKQWSNCIHNLPHDINKIINILCKYIYVHSNKIIKFRMTPKNDYNDKKSFDITIYIPYGVDLYGLYNKYQYVNYNR